MSALSNPQDEERGLTLSRLLGFGRHPRLIALAACVALLLWGMLVWRAEMPVWGATIIALAVIGVPMSIKWQNDLQYYGLAAVALSVLIALQSFHFLEHIVQVVQYYVLDRPPAGAFGLLSALNAEWVHFTWNWIVFAAICYLYARGMRGVWAVLLIAWSLLHSLEHTYMLVRYLSMLNELRALVVAPPPVIQAQAGILGRDGWLALSALCGRIPGLTTAPRIAVHFWWNLGETLLLVLAAWRGLPALARRLEPNKSS